ncbi:MAG: GNAT family N-acetyltransferase [Crocinitomicaceae bacterium]
MTIRNALAKDVAAIHSLIIALAVYEKEPNAVINTPENLLEDLFTHKRCFAIVAEDQKQIIGFALYYFGYSTWKGRTLYLEDIFVQENARKKGVGQALFNEILKKAKKEKVKRMDWQVLTWNTPAINFYKKNKAFLDEDWINGRLFF